MTLFQSSALATAAGAPRARLRLIVNTNGRLTAYGRKRPDRSLRLVRPLTVLKRSFKAGSNLVADLPSFLTCSAFSSCNGPPIRADATVAILESIIVV